jgi:hypothetical protein
MVDTNISQLDNYLNEVEEINHETNFSQILKRFEQIYISMGPNQSLQSRLKLLRELHEYLKLKK